MRKTALLLSLLFVFGQAAQAQPSGKPFAIGVIDSLPSAILNETRTINVYLPQSYQSDTAARYPVIYLLDGSADEDFIHVAGLVQFFNFPWINRFPESIVVGIANSNRKKDFTFPVANLDFLSPLGFDKKMFPSYGGSAAFISFIEKELQPYVTQHYRVTPSRTLIGQSLGGLLATEILLKKTGLFDTYVIISPSLWWNKEALLQHTPDLGAMGGRLKVYVGVGNEGNPMVADAKKLADLLKKNSPSTPVIFDYLPDEDHATIGHRALYNAFRLLYPIKK